MRRRCRGTLDRDSCTWQERRRLRVASAGPEDRRGCRRRVNVQGGNHRRCRTALDWPSAVRVLLLALALAALQSGTALAHAMLIESVPADDERLDRAPPELRLQFNEPVSPITIRLLDGRAAELPGVTVEPHGDTIVLHTAQPLPYGAYFLSYRVTSADAHVVAATLRFGVGLAPPGAGPGEDAPSWSAWAAVATRLLLYLTALGALGLSLFVLAARPPETVAAPTIRLAKRLALAGLAVLGLRLGLAGLELGGLPVGALAGIRPWTLAMSTTLAAATVVAAVGLTGIALGPRLPAAATAVAVLAVAISFGLTGHAATAPPRWLTAPALTLHVLCGAFWLGSLLPLLWSLDLGRQQAVQLLQRFSQAALVSVSLLVGAGGVLAWIQLGGDTSVLTTTPYGWRLFGKLALVAGLLALAAVNRLVLTPDLEEGRPGTARQLRRSFGAEIVLGLAVLAVTATFPLSPPPRALAATPDTVMSDGLTRGAPRP